eukprot:SAG31_NODE_3819_length_3852_cov_8.593658_1_plen_559_part_00
MHRLLPLLLGFLTGPAEPAPAADELFSLPGFDGAKLPSKHFSGYVPVGPASHRRQLRYWLQMSERDPGTDPVVLWLNGGPGASSIMYGALTEMGQLVFNSRSLRDNRTLTPKMQYNPHSWSRVASVIYLESPAGVGFSYCEYSPCNANDTTTAEDSYEFLVGFFKAFPELAANKFFLTGESYAGIYVPMLAKQIMDKGGVNLHGIAVGNGCWGNQVGTCSNALWVGDQQRLIIDFLAGHGLLSRQLYRQVGRACNFSWNGDAEPDAECLSMLMACHNQSGIKLHAPSYNVYDFCRSGIGSAGYVAPRPPARQSEMLAAPWAASPLAHSPGCTTSGTRPQSPGVNTATALTAGASLSSEPANGDEQRWCGSGAAAVIWQAIPAVASALHVNLSNGCDVPAALSGREPGPKSIWKALPPPANKCLNEYKRAPAGDLRPLYAELARRWPVLLYSGDADSCVPHVGTEEWVHELGFPVAEQWRPWLSLANGSGPVGSNGTSHIYQPDGHTAEAQRVGYVTTFGGDAVRLWFATVNGAGHEVPMYKPEAALALISRFLEGRSL